MRIVRPDVNAQDTDRRLFKERGIGNSIGWTPNARGLSFGIEVSIDETGFRKITPPPSSRKTWLFLGDSVTFGVGVAEHQVFPQLIQNRLSGVRVRNSAVTGYSILNYRDVVTHMLETHQALDRVILFYTLNDAYGNLIVRQDRGVMAAPLSLLRRHSRLYILAKDLATDRSKAYFMYDYALYAEDRSEWIQAMTTISEMGRTLNRHRIPFDVVLLPYEYQLRMAGGNFLRPQRLITQALVAEKINVIDLYDDFAGKERDSRDFFLFGDPMHLSILGHQVVSDALTARLRH